MKQCSVVNCFLFSFFEVLGTTDVNEKFQLYKL